MKKILFFAALLLLTSCSGGDSLGQKVNGIKSSLNMRDQKVIDCVDSLRVLAGGINDTTLSNGIKNVADKIEYELKSYNAESDLDDLMESFGHAIGSTAPTSSASDR